jgi:cytochrome c553
MTGTTGLPRITRRGEPIQTREGSLTMKRMLLSGLSCALLAVVGTAWADGDATQAGKAKAGSCAACHGAAGEGSGAAPALAGMKHEKFEKAMNEYKSGKRDNAMMRSLAKGLSHEDIDNLAAYYGSLKGK